MRGLLMGLADSVPGISGGTVAFLLGIHRRLVAAIAAIDRDWWRAWLRWDHSELARRDVPFLAGLALQIVVGLFVGAKLLADWLLPTFPVATMALFFGLILASIAVPARNVTWDKRRSALAVLAAIIAYWITVAQSLHLPAEWWILPLAGAMAACAMILPGISGAYLLLLLGLYEPVLQAVADLELVTIALVGSGAVLGLLAFSKGLHWLLDTRTHATHAVMVGLLVGSMMRLWPWRTQPGFAQGDTIVPGPWWPAAWIAAGLAVGVLIDLLAQRLQKPKGS